MGVSGGRGVYDCWGLMRWLGEMGSWWEDVENGYLSAGRLVVFDTWRYLMRFSASDSLIASPNAHKQVLVVSKWWSSS